MLVSTFFTTSQIIFFLRVIIQILSSGGLFLIGLLVLGNAPRIASVATHDVVSRIAGGETSTPASIKWLFNRRSNNDPTGTSKLAFAVTLLLSYSIFVKLTDVGVIGFHTCITRGLDSFDFPASVRDDVHALKLIKDNMINDTDPNAVKYFRCGASNPLHFLDATRGGNDTLYLCTAWTNSTYGEKAAFQGLNLSDTAVLMPRQLMRKDYLLSSTLELNGYYVGPLRQRITQPTVTSGLLIIPHETGFRAFLGAPNPSPFTRYTLPQTLVLEGDVGCMAMGMVSQAPIYPDPLDITPVLTQTFYTNPNGSWREYAGPDYLRGVISHAVDEVRDYLMDKRLWNASNLQVEPDLILNHNETWMDLDMTNAAHVKTFALDDILTDNTNYGGDHGHDLGRDIIKNCSLHLQSQLNVSALYPDTINDVSCNFLEIGGSQMQNGEMYSGFSKMVCAAGLQVNLARVEVEVDGLGNINVTFERIPSNLHVTLADWWFTQKRVGNTVNGTIFDPSYRYALTPNSTGAINHFIHPVQIASSNAADVHGSGSGADAFPSVGSMMLGARTDFEDEFLSLWYLEEGNKAINFTPSLITRWAGGVGASYIVGSSAFNGWAASGIQGGPIALTSTGGKDAICYDLRYAIAFIPLILAALSVLIMAFWLLFTPGLRNVPRMKDLYAGLQPYANFLLPNTSQTQTLLAWEHNGQPQLVPVENGQAVEISGTGTAVEHLYREKLNTK